MPDEKRAKAKADTTKPTAVLLTPKDFVNTGIAGKTIPNPRATKNEAMITTWTSLGNPETGDFKPLAKSFAGCFFLSFLKLHSCP
jgi:hypothetical protein